MNIAEYQAKLRERPQVWAVYINCAGEVSVDALYDSKEAAQMHKDWQNSRSSYFGRASISPIPIRNLELARETFAAGNKQ